MDSKLRKCGEPRKKEVWDRISQSGMRIESLKLFSERKSMHFNHMKLNFFGLLKIFDYFLQKTFYAMGVSPLYTLRLYPDPRTFRIARFIPFIYHIKLRCSVAMLFQLIARFARIRILNTRPDGYCEALVRGTSFGPVASSPLKIRLATSRTALTRLLFQDIKMLRKKADSRKYSMPKRVLSTHRHLYTIYTL